VRAYDRVPHEVLGRCLEKKEALATYIQVIKDIYEGVKISVMILESGMDDFIINIVLHQG